MKKQTKVLLAAAALTLGASFTAMAAETYDWKMEDGQWVCYDEDGDVYDNEWVKSAGKDYYAGDDGVMVASEWVDGFYLDSTGAKTTNAWKFILPDGVDADDDNAEEAWFYFGSKGAITKGKKVIDGQTYYFNTSGEMLTGWVDFDGTTAIEATEYNDDVVYVNEDGSRAADMWIKTVEPGVDEEEVDEPDYFWYYIGSKGAPKTGRQLDINGQTYFFNEAAQMLSGWVGVTGSNADEYEEITTDLSNYAKVYFCGGSNEGWAKKSTWINEYRSTVDTADVDEDSKYWFWIDSKGVVLKADTNTDSNAKEMTFAAKNSIVKTADSTTTHGKTKEINGKDYIFNQNGEMLSGLVQYGADNERFYYGKSSDGSMKTGEVVLEDIAEEAEYSFYFAKTKKDGYNTVGAAVTGAAAGKLYNGGILKTHSADEDYAQVVVGNKYYIIDEDGNIKTSQKQYKAKDDNDETYVYLDTTNTTFGKTGTAKGSFEVSAIVE